MTDDDPAAFELSRRKTLAALGTIGVASAGAGLGTSAYFSDTETFENNQLTAGSLDLKVDWEEHYSDWSVDESEGLNNDVLMEEPADGMYVGLPDPQDPLIWVHVDDLETFMNNTSIEAFPDSNDDGIQEVGPEFDYDACTQGADTPEDLDPTTEGALRTLNEDTYSEEDGVKPLIALDDVKPGDFGEATLSFHLCDNPGYVWLNGDLVEAAENGLTEPEGDDPDEQGDSDEVVTDVSNIPESDVEILDAIQTTWWYDEDGDNVLDGGEAADDLCVQIVLDASGSMTNTDGDGVSRNQEAINGAQQLAEEIINAGGSVGVTFFSAAGYSGGAQTQQSVADAGATDVTMTQNVIGNLPANGGSTAIGEGIIEADDDLANCDPGDRTIQIVVTDGQNNAGTAPSAAADDVTGGDADDYTGEIFAIGTGGATEASLLSFARPSDDVHAEFADDLAAVIANLSQVILGEKVFYRGSLGSALQALADGNGIPLDGNRATDFDEVPGDGLNDEAPSDPTSDSRECFINSVEHFIGFAWYLPVDHANEIQTDSVSFDLGFYTEQCRHNDGSGMNAEEVSNG